jgi:hypothetical protein
MFRSGKREGSAPRLGVREENYNRTHSPWSGDTISRRMEFGVSLGTLFETPGYRWIEAKG